MSDMSEIRKGLEYGFIDEGTSAEEAYKPRLIVNDFERAEKVLTSIQSELQNCESFFFSVAFVTSSGVIALQETLDSLKLKGIKGIIIASQYLNFSEPAALRKLLEYENIELLVLTEEGGSHHTKGYIFQRSNEYSIIVGSSNLTQNALGVNKEWNLKVIGSKDGGLVKETLRNFESLRSMATKINSAWINQYQLIYNERKRLYKGQEQLYDEREAQVISLHRVVPNRMQQEALDALEETRKQQKNKALIISATGTGKTYLAAFDVKKVDPKRFLFIVHREQIAKAAMKSFKRVFEGKRSMGLLSGSHKEFDREFVFATIQTISKQDTLDKIDPDAFDYIAIDEVHRAGAESYQKIMRHFRPRFLLGMSATPERTDGFDIYKMFDYNYPYEIRLRDAMKENMICPFHYFGVSELVVDGVEIDEYTEFSKLTSDARVDHVVEKIEHYGNSGERVKGLIFCSRNDEAIKLSEAFNRRGYRTVALSGKHSQEERVESIDRLEQKNAEGALDYIFTVDIFNEGVDIPAINQVVMLRPTQSAIIFVQQLGRGLRHYLGKEYVVVLDFIGNYEGNFLIPIALSGDQSYKKDAIRRFVAEGNKTTPGPSTINLDTVTRQKIYAAIDKAKFNDIRILKESYFNLKQKLGRIPKLMDFEPNGAVDVERIFDKSGSFHNFLSKYEAEYTRSFSRIESLYLQYISSKYANGKRPHELECINLLLQKEAVQFGELEQEIKMKYGVPFTGHTRVNLLNQMKQSFLTGTGKKTYKDVVFAQEHQGDLIIAPIFSEILKNPAFKASIEELIHFGVERYNTRYNTAYKSTNFQLYQKYTYEDVCRLLDWEQSLVPLNIGGYKFDKETNTFPVFINYVKAGVNHTINYEDEFLSPQMIRAISKSGRTADSKDVKQIYSSVQNGIKNYLFVRKNKEDDTSKEFYFLGEIDAIGEPEEFTMPNTTSTAVKIRYKLETPLREDVYDFITST